MTLPSDELKQMRRAAGFKSARAAAMALNIPVATYTQHERGSRPVTIAQFQAYGMFFTGVRIVAAQLREQQSIPEREALAAATYDALHRARHWKDATPETKQAYKTALEAVFRAFGINLPEEGAQAATAPPGAI